MTRRRRNLIAGLVAGSTLVVGVVGWLVVWPMLLLDGAARDLHRHEIAAARATLERFLEASPNHHRALLLAAQAARRAHAYADTERLLSRLETISGPSDASRMEWMLLGVQQGDFGDNESRLRSSVQQRPADAIAVLEALAKGYDAAYRWTEAIATLDRLLERSPDHLPALLLRGTIAQRLRQTEAAEKDFREAVKRAPRNAAARRALAHLLCASGHSTDALNLYQEALNLEPGNPEALFGLSRALLDAAQLEEAQRRLDELLTAQSDHTDALVERARLSLRRGRPAEAEAFLARAAKLGPTRRDIHQLCLIALTELKKDEAASQSKARLAELEAEESLAGRLKLRARDAPGDFQARWELWRWSVRNGQTEEGLAWLTEILRAEPGDRQAHEALADYFDRAGQPRRASAHRSIASLR